MKITLSIDSKETIEIGHLDLANIVNWLDDNEKYESFFFLLADHPSSDVRCAVADKTNCPPRALKKLARDPSVEVVRTVASNEHALKKLKLSLIQEMIGRDVSVAATIADYLHQVNEEIREEVIQALLQHADPKVVETAENFKRELE